MSVLIGKKIGMTSTFSEQGKNVACTVIEAGPCVVTQLRTSDKEGYEAIQLAFDEQKEKHTTRALKGHFDKAATTPKRIMAEFRNFKNEIKIGDKLTVTIFKEGEWIDVSGTSKGKGFQGVVRRHGFKGVGGRTHGQHNRERAPGSSGASSFPSRVFRGMRMAGRMGGNSVKVSNLQILKVVPEQNLLVVKGAVPGAKGSYVFIQQ